MTVKKPRRAAAAKGVTLVLNKRQAAVLEAALEHHVEVFLDLGDMKAVDAAESILGALEESRARGGATFVRRHCGCGEVISTSCVECGGDISQ